MTEVVETASMAARWPQYDNDQQFAWIGDALAEELTMAHYGTQAWVLGINEMTELTLVGTSTLGNIHFELPELTDWTQEGSGKLEGDVNRLPGGTVHAPGWAVHFADNPEETPDAQP